MLSMFKSKTLVRWGIVALLVSSALYFSLGSDFLGGVYAAPVSLNRATADMMSPIFAEKLKHSIEGLNGVGFLYAGLPQDFTPQAGLGVIPLGFGTSICLGSVCVYSVCLGSLFLGSWCVLSNCGDSNCGDSNCAASHCASSGCEESNCLNSRCTSTVCVRRDCPLPGG